MGPCMGWGLAHHGRQQRTPTRYACMKSLSHGRREGLKRIQAEEESYKLLY